MKLQLTNRILAEQAKISSEKIRRGQLSNDEFMNLVRAQTEYFKKKPDLLMKLLHYQYLN